VCMFHLSSSIRDMGLYVWAELVKDLWLCGSLSQSLINDGTTVGADVISIGCQRRCRRRPINDGTTVGTVLYENGTIKERKKEEKKQWAGEHFIFWAESFGPLRVNPLFTFNYTANYDGVNGCYYQIGVIKYNFLDYERYSNSLSSGC